jgi:hypothetical protein
MLHNRQKNPTIFKFVIINLRLNLIYFANEKKIYFLESFYKYYCIILLRYE